MRLTETPRRIEGFASVGHGPFSHPRKFHASTQHCQGIPPHFRQRNTSLPSALVPPSEGVQRFSAGWPGDP